MHHDFVKLPNGNYLYLAWEPVPPELREKIRGGIKGTEFEAGAMFNDKLVEIHPQGKVVWEWRANDHMDPERDIIGPIYKREEWYHGNGVCALTDGNIALSGRFTDSLLVIDRQTGKIISRWGNTAYLDQATGRIECRTGPETLGGPHDVREIPAGYPGAGNLTCYDNGTYASGSRVVEIDRAGKLVWQSPDPKAGRKHYSYHLAGAERLRNGNTLVCDGANGRFFQMTKDGQIVWEYVNPFIASPKYQGAVFKAHFYRPDYCPQFQTLLPADLPLTGTMSTIRYECQRVADDAVRVDGVATEPAWGKATPMENFQTAYANPQPANYQSTVRLLWSEKHLFLAFECATDAIYSTTLTNRDDNIWNEECAELFLCPRGPEAKYYEIDFNPQNVMYDSLLTTYRYEEQVAHYRAWALAYNARVNSQTKIQRDADGNVTGWTVEAAIPLADLAEADHVPPQPGDVWLFNAFRIAKKNEKDLELSAWIPTLADFHRPWMFPQLKFAD